MPVDLKQIGPPRQYPPAGPRARTWLFVWAACVIVITGGVLLLWPVGTPAKGLWFWLLAAGLPTGVFIALFSISRAAYEGAHLMALYYNDHRETRRQTLIAQGQQALHLLASAHCLPMESGTLAKSVIEGPALLKAQPTRDGRTIVRHTRLPDDLDGPAANARLAQVLRQAPSLSRHGRLHAHLIAPLATTLDELLRCGLAPAVRLIVGDGMQAVRELQQLRTVIRAWGLPVLDCDALPTTDGLMVADAWLDAQDPRPLLVIAAQLNDIPVEGSAEGGTALLLAASSTRLPETVTPRATLCRPVAAQPDALAEGMALAMLWGRCAPETIEHAWTTGFDAQENALVADACRATGLNGVSRYEARHIPERAIGHAGAAAGWLAVAAAMEHAANSPQLIMNRVQAVQTAVLYAQPANP
jgi:hypothetical protein